MSFIQLHKDVLLQVADYFSVDVGEKPTKQTIIAAFAEAEPPVTWELYKEHFPDIDDLPDKEEASQASEKFTKDDEPVLLKMERGNYVYQVRGYNFSKTHPFVLVQRADADFILANIFGFRVASPEEVRKYYS